MKRALLVISVSLGLACAASPALADDKVIINQNSSGSMVTVEQAGNVGMNQVMVNQGQAYNGGYGGYPNEGWGGNQVQVMQMQVADSSVTVDQTGPGTYARVEQAQSLMGNASVMQNSFTGNLSAEILQSGAHNRADITQFGSNMSASIMQGMNTSHNIATVIQRH